MFFQCLSSMALYGSAMNQPGNIIPHSRACCSLVHLGVGSAWQTFCCSPVEETSSLNQPGSITPPFLCPMLFTTSGCGFGWAKLLLQPYGEDRECPQPFSCPCYPTRDGLFLQCRMLVSHIYIFVYAWILLYCTIFHRLHDLQ